MFKRHIKIEIVMVADIKHMNQILIGIGQLRIKSYIQKL